MLRFVHVKIYVCVLLIFVFILQVSMNTIVCMKFKTSQTYISQKLCVNRNNPASSCFGKCYLKNELKKSDAKEKRMQSYSKDKIVLFFIEVQQLLESVPLRNKNRFSDLVVQKEVCSVLDIFHPPAVSFIKNADFGTNQNF